MAYDYIGIVNDVNRRLNEVELTATNFSTAKGEYSMIKDAVNASLRFINQHEYEWPFNHVEEEETLTPGLVRYAFPSDAKVLDFDSFRIKRDATLGNATVKLKALSYEEYLESYVDIEYNTSTGIRKIPAFVVKTPSQEYAIVQPADKAYTVVYEYYRLPVDLINSTDVPTIPEQFRYVIVNAIVQQRFEQEIKQMRSLYINRYDYVRSTVLTNTLATNTRVTTL